VQTVRCEFMQIDQESSFRDVFTLKLPGFHGKLVALIIYILHCLTCCSVLSLRVVASVADVGQAFYFEAWATK
jgi:hypothetical protein